MERDVLLAVGYLRTEVYGVSREAVLARLHQWNVDRQTVCFPAAAQEAPRRAPG